MQQMLGSFGAAAHIAVVLFCQCYLKHRVMPCESPLLLLLYLVQERVIVLDDVFRVQ
jgi:hypothetical protein